MPNHLFCFSLCQLDHIVQTYVEYHNRFGSRQGLVIDSPPASMHNHWKRRQGMCAASAGSEAC